jgi:chromosome segregation ATPase
MSSSAPFFGSSGSFLDTNFNFSLDSQFPPNLNMELPELLKHPSVMELYRQNQALLSSQIKLQETQSKLAEKSFALHDKNQALQDQIHTLESELSASQLKVKMLSTELQSLQVNTNL